MAGPSPSSAPVRARIRRSADYRRVLRNGTRTSGGLVIAYVQATGGPTRVGYVCSRTVGSAVVRNRARRLMKEAWRGLLPRVREGFDLVLVARPEIRGAGMLQVQADLTGALEPAGVVDE